MTDTHVPFETGWIRQQLTCGQVLDREQVRALLAAYEDALARLQVHKCGKNQRKPKKSQLRRSL